MEYIFFDLETTGLNTKTDEPIQIGIIKTSDKFEIIKTFYSNIKPASKSKITDIVNFITKIKEEDLINSPSFEDLKDEIKEFFNGEIIIIGHNILFDIEILNRYIPIKHIPYIDTHHFSHSLTHFIESRSLENLLKTIGQNYKFKREDKRTGVFHDALADCYGALDLFVRLKEKLENLYNKNRDLGNYILKSDSPIKYLFPSLTNGFCSHTIPFPQKMQSGNVNIKKDNKEIENPIKNETTTIEPGGVKEILEYICNIEGEFICVFSHGFKINIAKKILNRIGYKNIGYLKEECILDPNLLSIITRKDRLSEIELLFLIKLFSQNDAGLSVLDMNNYVFGKIYNAIKKNNDNIRRKITLTTHGGIYQNISKIDPNTKIVFFDHESWFKTINIFGYPGVDLNSILAILESIEYRNNLLGNNKSINKIVSQISIFIGVISIELIKFFEGKTEEEIIFDSIYENNRFWRTNKLIYQINENIKHIKNDSNHVTINSLIDYIENLFEIIDNQFIAQKKMYGNIISFYIKPHIKYTNYDEFRNMFSGHQTYYINTSSFTMNDFEKYGIKIVKDLGKLEIENQKKTYIVLPSKSHGQKLFDLLIKNENSKYLNIMIENITSSRSKIITTAKLNKSFIIGGGIEILGTLISEGVKFDNILFFPMIDDIHIGQIKDIINYEESLL